MFAGSAQVVVLVAVMGFASVAVFVWAWWTGKLDDLEAQSLSILDVRDLRLRRQWESADERAARERSFGASLEPLPGEWGDARGL